MNDYVTERELKAHLEPIQSDVSELKTDMKTVVAYINQQKGAKSSGRKLSDRRLAYAAIVAGAIAPVAWLHIPGLT